MWEVAPLSPYSREWQHAWFPSEASKMAKAPGHAADVSLVLAGSPDVLKKPAAVEDTGDGAAEKGAGKKLSMSKVTAVVTEVVGIGSGGVAAAAAEDDAGTKSAAAKKAAGGKAGAKARGEAGKTPQLSKTATAATLKKATAKAAGILKGVAKKATPKATAKAKAKGKQAAKAKSRGKNSKQKDTGG